MNFRVIQGVEQTSVSAREKIYAYLWIIPTTKSLEKTTEVEGRERTPNKTEPEKHPAYSPLKKSDRYTNK